MNTQELFLRTLDDLENRISSNDDYTVLRASALIRELFLDGERLVDKVNQPFGFKFKFEIIDTDQLLNIFKAPGMPLFEFVGIQDALDPNSIPNPPKKMASRDAFFNTKIQISNKKSFTVSELILHQANIEGGVHALSPRNDKEVTLSQIEDSLRILGLPAGLQQLKSIGRVVIKTLQPLRMALICNKAIEVDPKNVAAYYNRGIVYAMSGKLREAIADFDKAIEFGSTHPQITDCYYNRGHTFIRLALLDLEQYVRLAPDSPEKETVQKVVEQMRAGGM